MITLMAENHVSPLFREIMVQTSFGAKVSHILPAQIMFVVKNLIFFQLYKKIFSITLLLFSTNNSTEVEGKTNWQKKMICTEYFYTFVHCNF
jgi:hypothetical protein